MNPAAPVTRTREATPSVRTLEDLPSTSSEAYPSSARRKGGRLLSSLPVRRILSDKVAVQAQPGSGSRSVLVRHSR